MTLPFPVAKFLATWFGAGLLPKAPGTWGSLAAVPFAWGLYHLGGRPLLAAATVAVSLIGWWASEVYIRKTGIQDPGEVVIDEVAGQWLTLLVVPPVPLLYLAGFALFRLFDIRKPWPVSWADTRIGGGLGVMVDDLFAGIYAALCLWAIAFWVLPS